MLVVVTDVALVKEVTTKKFRTFHDRTTPAFVTKLSAKGLVFSKGAEWSASKNALLPLFHKNMLHGFLPIMSFVSTDLLACLRCVPPSVPVDLNELLHKMAMDVIGEVALGVRFGLLTDERQHLAKAHGATPTPAGRGGAGSIKEGQQVTGAQGEAPGLDPGFSNHELYDLMMETMRLSSFEASISNLIILLCAPLGRGLRELLARVPGTTDHRFRRTQVFGVRRFVQMCIGRKKQVGTTGDVGAVAATAGSEGMPGKLPSSDADGVAAPGAAGVNKDAMTFLLSAINRDTKQPFPMESVAGLATELIAAGSDTTANTLAFALYCVSGDPAVEARVVEEVLAPGRGPGVPITHEDLEDKFPYVEAVIKESLRVYPPVAAMTRVALEDVELGGHFIPAGTGVIVPAMAMNMDPKVFPNPDVFNPDRFRGKGGEEKKDYPHLFNPFGVGPRMCLGHRFAMLEAMLVFIRLYQNFSFARAPPTSLEVPLKVQHTIVSKPKNGVWMYVTPRVAA
eukprot:jgi/Mesvir1/4709/Mv05634-RA.2